jgi:hypothetical protein
MAEDLFDVEIVEASSILSAWVKGKAEESR